MTAPTRTALVIGAAGQDGRLLEQHLTEQGHEVLGVHSDGSVVHRGSVVGIAPLDSATAVRGLVERVQPDEVFYLAAHHHSSETAPAPDLALWRRSFAVHCDGLLVVLEALLACAPRAHLVFASSSHVFGEPDRTPQDERTPLRPTSPYAVTKAAAMAICASYRKRGFKASSAILFTHESPLRRSGFLVPRVVSAVARAAHAGERSVRLEIGAPEAVVDWSWAPDVVRAMYGIAGLAEAGEFVVASGMGRTVRELCEVAGAHAGVAVDIVTRPETVARRTPTLVGDPTLLRSRVSLPAPVPFSEWVGMLVDAARAELRQAPEESLR
jgi:GDPmannose 4,6-dehydratase